MSQSKNRESDLTIVSRTMLIVFLDILATVGCFFCGLWLRFDFRIGYIQRDFMGGFASNMLVWCAITVVVFALFRLYSSVWLYVNASEIFRIIGAYCVLGVIGVTGVHFYGVALPRSSCIIGFVFSFMCTVAIRFSYRLLKTFQVSISRMLHATGIPNVMIIGAGDAGKTLAEEYISSEILGEHLSCFIDDNPGLRHKRLCGVPIAGSRKTIPEAVRKYGIDKIIFAIPSASAVTRKNILEICCTTGCKVLVLPDVRQMEDSSASVQKLRRVLPQDLLGQPPVEIRREEISELISGKSVLVTGGAGTVGSELCRQIARLMPRRLILLDMNEKASYELQLELLKTCPELELSVVIGSLQNRQTIQKVFSRYSPDLVFHCAAYKYISYMENNAEEAAANNIFSTYELVKAAEQYGVQRFLLISTDRAENPATITGATKRISEMILQYAVEKSSVKFAAVRFGNLLNCSGSVVELFRNQIEMGGPVTVTHPDVTRYFMSTEEAVSLILQTMVYVQGGEIFSLDMGDPVKIDNMARSLIRLSGHEPDTEIKVQYIGLRPGEKLHETQAVRKAGIRETGNRRIFVNPAPQEDLGNLPCQLENLKQACDRDTPDVKAILQTLVPSYQISSAESEN